MRCIAAQRSGERDLVRKTTRRDGPGSKNSPNDEVPPSDDATEAVTPDLPDAASDTPSPPKADTDAETNDFAPTVSDDPASVTEAAEGAPPPTEEVSAKDATEETFPTPDTPQDTADETSVGEAETPASEEVSEPADTVTEAASPPEETPADTTEAPASETATDPVPTDVSPETAEDARADAEPQGTDTPAEPEQAAAPVPPPPTPATPPAAKPSIFPLLLGGVLAGGIGFGAQTYLNQTAQAPVDLSQLQGELADLRAQLAAVPGPADLSPLEAELADLRDQITALPEPEAASVDLDVVADQLRAEFGQADTIDLEPLESRIAALADMIADQQSALDSTGARLSGFEEDLADLRDMAENRILAAEAAIDAARARAGVDSLRAALETGVSYRHAIDTLTEAGVDVPQALVAPADSGVATLEDLQEGFDDAARNALRVALQDAPAESTADRLTNFLRAQVGARSTVPRDGDDPDAVLSRAAAAMEAGDLQAALSEIDSLPGAAQDAMGGWLTAARARVAAQAALPDLISAITTE